MKIEQVACTMFCEDNRQKSRRIEELFMRKTEVHNQHD